MNPYFEAHLFLLEKDTDFPVNQPVFKVDRTDSKSFMPNLCWLRPWTDLFFVKMEFW